MNVDFGRITGALSRVRSGGEGGFRLDPSFSLYFAIGSWVFAAAVIILFAVSRFVWDLEMSTVTSVLWVAAPLIGIPVSVLALKGGDQLKGWLMLTVFSFVTMAMLSIAMYTWIETGHGTFDKDMFFRIVSAARYAVIVWAVFAVVNMAAFLISVFTRERAQHPERSGGDPGFGDPYGPAEEYADVSEELPAGYRRDMDIILADIDRFSDPYGMGMVERQQRGGN